MFTLYVGSPNATHTIDDNTFATIKRLTSKFFESYTFVKARGVYKDTEEDTVLITIANAKKADVYSLGKELQLALDQVGVAVEHNGKYESLIP